MDDNFEHLKEHPLDIIEVDENGELIIYPHKAPPQPPNYHKWPTREHSNWEDMDLHERLTADPSYIDRI